VLKEAPAWRLFLSSMGEGRMPLAYATRALEFAILCAVAAAPNFIERRGRNVRQRMTNSSIRIMSCL
jgi:hypothetical protein